MATTLTERYISATISSLPPDSQEDVRAELEGSIADAVDARLDQGEEPEPAERAVLTELGDPAALAASYADRPLHLIGPRFYLAWWRLLKLLLIIVPLVAMGGVALGKVIEGGDVGEVIAAAIVAGLGAIVHVSFWVTLVFVILERTDSESTIGAWDVDQLPEPRSTGAGRSEVVASVVFAGLMIAAMLWDRFRGFVWIDGHDGGVQILHPQLWPWVILGLVALLMLEVGHAVLVQLHRGWSTGLAVANTALAVVWVSVLLTLLGNGLLVNPEFMNLVLVEGGGGPETVRVVGVLFVLSVVGSATWDITDGWRKAGREATRRGSGVGAAH